MSYIPGGGATVGDGTITTTKLGGDITTAGKAILDDADVATQRTTLGLGTAATAASTAFEAAGGIATHAAVTSAVHGISAFGATLVDDADNTAARTTLGLGTLATQSGTFSGTSSGTNTGDVSLAGTPDYITISGQTITRGQIDLTTDVTGDLPLANVAPASAGSRLLGRGSVNGAGDFEEVTLGTGLTMTGTSLAAHAQSHAITSTSDHTANNWKVWYSNGSGQVVELALGANGTVLTSSGASGAPTFSSPAGGGAWVTVKQTADDSKTNNTLAASTYLTVALSAATLYTVRGRAYLLVQNAAADARFDLNYSGTWTTIYCMDRRNIAGVAAGTDNQTTRIASALPASTDVLATVTGLVIVEFELSGLTNASGTLSFRFAQVTNNATATLLKAGSYMEYMTV